MGRASVVLPSAPITAIDEYLAPVGERRCGLPMRWGRTPLISEADGERAAWQGRAGFPTGAKWASVRAAGGGTHYAVAKWRRG